MAEQTKDTTPPPPDQEVMKRTAGKLVEFLKSLPEEERHSLPYLLSVRNDEVQGYMWGIHYDCQNIWALCDAQCQGIGLSPWDVTQYGLQSHYYQCLYSCQANFGC